MNEIIKVKTVTQANEFLGVGKPKHPLVSVVHHDDKNFRREYPEGRYVLDLYQISFKDGISGSLGYGRNSYDFQEGTLLLTSPGQVITMSETVIESDITGWSLYFHPDLICKSPLGKMIDDYSFFSYDVHEALHLSDDEKSTLTGLVEKIEDEYNQNIDRHSQKLIVSNIELLLDYCTRYYDRQFYTRTNLNKDIVTRFERLLKDYYKDEKPIELGVPSVSYCGKELNMSPNYLSDLLKKETGRNAMDHIHTFIIEKAKTILLNSENTVSEIAYDLGFEYPQYFSKLFKSKTGTSPAAFRNLN
ncbi:helix-turn-helix domain-containing protein [bacterium]|nr:helix-turn-helix domain-containing protein [bacterium]